MSKHSRNGHLGAAIGKSRLFAGLTALAMMAACVIPAAMPQNALADGVSDLGNGESGFITPGDIHLGDQIADTNQADSGIATWVGRDMYVGGRTGGENDTGRHYTNANSGADGNGNYVYTNAPGASYAAEAEGLTVVRGKLAINQVKNSWAGKYYCSTDNNYISSHPWVSKCGNGEDGKLLGYAGGQGFRFGVAGFGAQFRPAIGQTALAVAGLGSAIASMNGSSTASLGHGTIMAGLAVPVI